MNYIYTCITNSKDILNEKINSQGAKLICFTDEDIKSEKWEIIKIPKLFIDDRRNSRLPKLLPHIYLPEDCEYSLYLDGNIINTIPIQKIINEWLQDTDMACFRHDTRDCYFEEAKECSRLGLDDKEIIIKQLKRYYKYPRHMGLYQGGVLLRKHTDKVRQFNESWFAEYCGGSKRDQISFPIARDKAGLAINAIQGHAYYHPYFNLIAHKKPSEWAGKI